MTKDDFISIVEHYVPNKQDRDIVLSAAWDYSEALIAAKPLVSRCYVVQDLEASPKDIVWAVCSTPDEAEKSKQALINSTGDDSIIVDIAEMDF